MKYSDWRKGFVLVLLACCVPLSGCIKVGPDFLRPKTAVSPKWMEAGDQRLKSGAADYRAWWKEFNDPVLDRIIDRAYGANLSLRVAGVRVLEARAQLGIAVGGLYPQTQQATGSLAFNRTSEVSPSSAASLGGLQQQHSYWQDQGNFNISWELDFWGKFRRAVESADAGLLAAVADYDSTLVGLTADAASTYIRIRTLEKRLAIARQNADTQAESLLLAETRFKGGVTSERDVEQARTALYNTLATIPGLEAQLRQAKNALCVLMGLPPDDLAGFLEGPGEIPTPPLQVAVGIPADLIRRRPDLRSAEFQAAAQSARIGIAKADLLPAFSLTGSFGLLSSSVGTFSLADMFTMKAGTVTTGPGFQWNILNYGRITNAVRVEDAKFQELLISYQDTVLRAQQEVEDSLAGFLRAQETADYLAQSALAAQRSLDLAFIQYRQGSTDFTTVLVAQQALHVTQDSFANALGNISGNLVLVYRALGGGWQIREGRDFVPEEIKAAMAKRTNWGNLLTPASHTPPADTPGPTVRWPDW
ncbi:MAG: efflux transporter outer membrane subunit [Syntrophobacteraceae bacterium]